MKSPAAAETTNASWFRIARLPEDDIGRQLGLVGPAAWALLALYAPWTIVQAVLFGMPTTATPLGVAAILGLIAGAGLLASPATTPLPLWRAALLVFIVIGAVALITWNQPFHDHAPGFAAWELGSGNFLLFLLAVRGRVLWAWLGELVVICAVCGWSVQITGSPLYGLSFSYGQPISLVAGTVFAIALRRTATRIMEFRAAEQERAVSEGREAALAKGQEAELRSVRHLAVPMLEAIARRSGPDRAEARILEAGLRDLVRGRSLVREPLAKALRDGRGRGIDIVVLDDLVGVGPAEAELDRAARWCAELIRDRIASFIIIRIAHSDFVEPRAAIVTVSIDGAPSSALMLAARDPF